MRWWKSKEKEPINEFQMMVLTQLEFLWEEVRHQKIMLEEIKERCMLEGYGRMGQSNIGHMLKMLQEIQDKLKITGEL